MAGKAGSDEKGPLHSCRQHRDGIAEWVGRSFRYSWYPQGGIDEARPLLCALILTHTYGGLQVETASKASMVHASWIWVRTSSLFSANNPEHSIPNPHSPKWGVISTIDLEVGVFLRNCSTDRFG